MGIKTKHMMRHLKNISELSLYASISCGLAFFARIYPAFYFPILMLRIAILGYSIYIIGGAENNREFAMLLGSAIVIGFVGGNWDWIEVYVRFNQEKLTLFSSLILFVFLAVAGYVIYSKVGSNENTSKK